MPDASVRSHASGWINQIEPHKNHGKGNRLWVQGAGSGHQRQSFIGFGKPFPHNDALVVVSATLRLVVKDDWSGSHDVTVKRIQESWKEHKLSWNNAPDVAGANAATENITNEDSGTPIDIDVTDIMGDIALGEDWFGFRLELDDDVPRTFYADDAPQDWAHPKLSVEWGWAPYPPTDLDPSGMQVVGTAFPVLIWAFRDIQQDTSQSASQVQIDDNTTFATPIYNSGKQANTTHKWATIGEAPPIPDGATRYWRVKTWDDHDRGSGWSDVVGFKRVSKGLLSFVYPGTDGTVDDLTPFISWAFSGEQERVELKLLEVLPDRTTRERWIQPDHVYTKDHLTIPARKKHPIIKKHHNYRLKLKVWDDEDRVGVPNDTAYAYAQQDFVYERDGTPAPVETMTATIAPFASPAVLFNWTISETPDYFALVGNDEEIFHRINPTDVAVAGSPGHFQMLYWEATPGEATEYEIEAVEIVGDHNKHSSGNPQHTLTTNPTGVWIIDDDYDEAVFMRGADTPDFAIGESGTTYDLVANPVPVRIVDAVRGYEGSFSGLILDDDTRKRLLEIKFRTKELRIVIGKLNLPIYLEEISISPSSQIPSKDAYEVTVNFFQSDEYGAADEEEY